MRIIRSRTIISYPCLCQTDADYAKLQCKSNRVILSFMSAHIKEKALRIWICRNGFFVDKMSWTFANKVKTVFKEMSQRVYIWYK